MLSYDLICIQSILATHWGHYALICSSHINCQCPSPSLSSLVAVVKQGVQDKWNGPSRNICIGLSPRFGQRTIESALSRPDFSLCRTRRSRSHSEYIYEASRLYSSSIAPREAAAFTLCIEERRHTVLRDDPSKTQLSNLFFFFRYFLKSYSCFDVEWWHLANGISAPVRLLSSGIWKPSGRPGKRDQIVPRWIPM